MVFLFDFTNSCCPVIQQLLSGSLNNFNMITVIQSKLPWKSSLFATEWRKATKLCYIYFQKRFIFFQKFQTTLLMKTGNFKTHSSLHHTSTNDFIDHNTPQSLESQPAQFQIRSTFISDFQNFSIYLPISNSSRYNRQSNAISFIHIQTFAYNNSIAYT